MKNKFLKTRIMISILTLLIIVVFFYYNPFLIVGNQRLEAVPISKEMKELEKQIRAETKSGDYTYFNGVSKARLKKCNGLFEINLSIDNDSIIHDGFDKYVKGIEKRVNNILKNDKCIDSIIVRSSINETGKDKSIRKRYSFPVQ